MSAEKSEYPERPQGGKRPTRPGEGRKKPSSEHIAGKRNVWLEQPKAPGGKLKEAVLDSGLCIIGHSNKSLRKFLRQHRANKVRVRYWGGRVTEYI